MSLHQMESPAGQKNLSANMRLPGILGMLCAPMLLVEMVIRALMNDPEKLDERFIGFLGVFYIGR